ALTMLWLAPTLLQVDERTPLAIAGWLALVFALTALGIVGDLFKSLLKRQRGIKDSGRILPGHAGVVDRIDALLAVMPPAALLAQYAVHSPWPTRLPATSPSSGPPARAVPQRRTS